MSALTSLLARDQAVPVRKIEEALQKQVVSGGDIGTVLLELDAIGENTLAAFEAALVSLLPATRDEVMRVPRDTVRLVPREVAEKNRLIPLAVDGRALLVAVAAPLPPDVESQIGFLLGYEIVARVVPEVRIAAGLQHHYGVEPSARMRRLIEKLRHREAGEIPYVAPPEKAKVSRAALAELSTKKKSAASSWLDDDDEDEEEAPKPAPRRSSMPLSEGRTTDPLGVPAKAASVLPPPEKAVSVVPPPKSLPPPAEAAPEAAPAEPAPRVTDPGLGPTAAPIAAGEEGEGTATTPGFITSPGATRAESAVQTRVVGVGVRRSSRPPAPLELPVAAVIPKAAPLPVEASREAAPPPAPRESAPRSSAPVAAPPFVSSQPPREVSSPGIELSEAQRAIRKLRGPLTAGAAVKMLDSAAGRDDVLAIFFAFARQFFDYAALFAVTGELAEGRDAFGTGAALEAVRRIAIPLDVPGTFSAARKARKPVIGPLAASELDTITLRDLGRPAEVFGIVFPIVLRERAVLLLYGDRGGDEFELNDLPELMGFAPRVVDAIERIILRKKSLPGGGRAEFVKPEAKAPERNELKAAARSVGSLPPSRPSRELRGGDRWSAPPPAERRPAPVERDIAPRSLIDAIQTADLLEAAPPVEPTARPIPAIGELPEQPRPSDLPAAPPADMASIVRAPRRAATLRKMAGIPRSAPPPPKSDVLDLGMLPIPGSPGLPASVPVPVVSLPKPEMGRDTFPDGLLPPSTRNTEPAPPPSAPSSDDEPEMEVGSADPSEFDDIESSDPGDDEDEGETPRHLLPPADHPHETYLYKEASVDVIPSKRSRRSDRPASISPRAIATREPARDHAKESAAKDSGSKRRVDPRREDDESPTEMAERVRVSASVSARADKMDRSERVTANIRPASARPSTVPPAASGSRSVIVDMGDGVNELVQDLVHAGPDGEAAIVSALLKLGDAPLPALAQAFPGPLWFDRRRPHRKQPRGRDVSAIARALFGYRERAVPYVASMLGASDADHRYYATMLASDIVHGGLVDALAQRVFDDDEGVRKLASEALAKHRGLPEMNEALVGLRRAARLRGKDPQRRLRAINALGTIRDGGALRMLVELLEDEEGAVVHAAHLALVAITCEDLGANARKWAAWADRNEPRHRIEWLIDALTHGDETLRSAAGEDLKTLTQQYFGFHPSASKKDREVVQAKYRTWWETQGRRIHTGR